MKLLTIAEAAVALRVSESYLYKRTRVPGAIPHTRLGRRIRFTAEHLAAILAAGEPTAIAIPTRDEIAERRARARRRTA